MDSFLFGGQDEEPSVPDSVLKDLLLEVGGGAISLSLLDQFVSDPAAAWKRGAITSWEQ